MEFFPTFPLSFFDECPAIFFRCNQHGISREFSFLTPSVKKVFGISTDFFLNNPKLFFQKIYPEDQDKFLRSMATYSSLPLNIQLDYRIMGDGGRVVWVQENSILTSSTHSEGIFCQGVIFEIFHYQKMQEELQRWDRQLESLTCSLPDIIVRADRKKRLLYLNRSWDGLAPVLPEQYFGKRFVDVGVPQSIAELFEAKIHDVYQTFQSSKVEVSCSTQGELRLLEVRFCPEFDEHRIVLNVLLVCRDITEVRTAELACKESDEKFRQLAETIDSVLWIWDKQLEKIIYVSPAYERLWGGKSSQLLQNPFAWLALVVPDDRNRVEHLFIRRIGGDGLDIEYRIFNANHETRWIHNRTFPMKDSSGVINRVIGIAQDVTDRKKWEEERIKGAKLESLGLLAGGLAHDFNNLLTAILGQLSLAKYSLEPESSLYVRISEAEKASERAQDIASQLLTFSKGGVPIKKVVSLKDFLEDNVRLVLTGSNLKPVFRIPGDLWMVNVDVGQICQVIHNLVINARQAMPNGGECLVEACNVIEDINAETLNVGDLGSSMSRRYICLSIRDFGVGISNENLQKIFDPYFTTKATGSGLGLATSYSIVKNHGGVIWVESELGRGSAFFIKIPAVIEEKENLECRDFPTTFGHGKILIMDDEIQIRKVLGEMVEVCGYSYQTVPNGEEALEVFRHAQTAGSPFSAVILDLTIPGGLGGKDVMGQLLKMDPQVKAIVASGYSHDPVLANYRDYAFKGRVAKPFNLADLSIVLNEVLQC